MFGNSKWARSKWRQCRKLFNCTVGVRFDRFFRSQCWRTCLARVSGRLKICRQCTSWRRITRMAVELGAGDRQHFMAECFVNALQPVTFVKLVVGLQNVTATSVIHRWHTERAVRCTVNMHAPLSYISTQNSWCTFSNQFLFDNSAGMAESQMMSPLSWGIGRAATLLKPCFNIMASL